MKPVRDPKYLAFIRSLPCAIQDCAHNRIEAAHTSAFGPRGMAQKADDRSAIPLCTAHHKEYHQIGERAFEQRYSLDIKALVDKLNIRPYLYVSNSRWFGRIEGREYLLGHVEIGWDRAVKRMVDFRREELRAA